MESLREQWRRGRTTVGGWLVVPSTVTAEAAARTGVDYVCIDTQHGAIDYAGAVGMIQAILLGGTSPIVRVPGNDAAIIGKMLDAGAHGIIIPMVNSAEEADAAVHACRYAPHGTRSYGPTVSGMRRSDYASWSTDHVAVIPMIETVEAVARVEEIVAVPGVDAVYVGPADLSMTLGLPAGNHDEDPRFAGAIERVVTACADAGVIAGVHSTGAIAPRRLAAGFRMVTVVNDLAAMRAGFEAELERARAAVGGRGGD